MTVSLLKPPAILPLQPGDRLTGEEFMRRYHAMPEVKKAELIEGEVHMPSPVSHAFHGYPHGLVVGWLFHYHASTPGVEFSDNPTDRLDPNNVLQPDALLFTRPESGGRVTIDEDGYLNGAPELIVEISASRVSIDLGKRLNVYLRHGVSEYVVWRVYDDAIDWFILRDGAYVSVSPDPVDGHFKSEMFPGLWLDQNAFFRRDSAAVVATLTRGLASPEHAAFVAQLAARRQTT